jgi:serine/threonine protein kinase
MADETTDDRPEDACRECPARGEIADFNRGKLPVDDLVRIATHIGRCPRCEAMLRELSDESDPLIICLRSSRTDVQFFAEPACARLEARARALAGSSDPSAAGPPERLGPYQLLRRIKGGGMGEVYEAVHTRLGRRVALKTLRADRMQNPHFIARFNREMTAVGKLQHPNIVRASDAGEVDGWHFLVMDFIDGADLATLARRAGPLRIADAAELARQAALGLQCVHEHGLVHRDVKPSNLMLADDGAVKVLDLGLALLHENPTAGDELTETGLGMGTADYMSPEQAQDAHHVTIQSDLYSLGCTLYKLLTGRAPFDMPPYQSALKKMHAHLHEPVPPVQALRPDTRAELAAVVHRLLEKAPERRFATPQEAAWALEPFAVGSNLPALLQRAHAQGASPGEAPVTSSLPPIARSAATSMRKRWATGAVVALVACALVVAIVFRPRDAAPVPDPAKDKPANDKPDGPAVVAKEAPIQWPEDFPITLRDRPLGKRIALVERGKAKQGARQPHEGVVVGGAGIKGQPFLPYQPLWSRRLAGTGLYFCQGLALTLNSSLFDKQAQGFTGMTALALDDDRALRWFEFDAELWPIWPAQAGAPDPRAGIFFGWRAAEKPGQVGAYFVELVDRFGAGNDAPPGWVLVNHVTLPADPVAAGKHDEAIGALAVNPLAHIPLLERSKRYHLHVRAVKDSLSIAINRGNAAPIPAPFEPRGSLGVWVQRGHAWFGDVSVTTLSDPVAAP